MSSSDPSSSPDPAIGRDLDRLSDPLRPLKVGLRFGLIGMGILAVAGVVVFGAKDGLGGVWGALMGAAVGGAFFLVTIVVVMATANSGPSTTMGAILGSWAVKLIVLIAVMSVLKGMDFYSQTAFGVVMIAAVVLVLGAEAYGVIKTRSLYVIPESDSSGDAGS